MKSFYAHGKFLITSEYAVLENVTALAVPLVKGQRMTVEKGEPHLIQWKSFDSSGTIWFMETFLFVVEDNRYECIDGSIDEAVKLLEILKSASQLNPDFDIEKGYNISSYLEFDASWGMGSSSTLISLLAQWTSCNPYELQFKSFGGSGYDIACATSRTALTYKYNNAQPLIEYLDWNPSFKEKLFFVHLNKKQNSRESISRFQERKQLSHQTAQRLEEITQVVSLPETNFSEFVKLLEEHEQLISELIGLTPVKEILFPDFTGLVKSLGGWGGDFVLCTGGKKEQTYFMDNGYTTIFEWKDIVL